MLDLYTVALGLLIILPLLQNFFFPYFWLDLLYIFSIISSVRQANQRFQRNPPFTLLDSFLEKVQKHPEKPLILFGEEVYSYQDINRQSSQAARVLQGHVGLKEGQTVAVFLKNTPTYLWIWMGLEKIGCTMACINYNIRSKPLLHVLSCCDAKVLLTTPDFQAAIEDVLPVLKSKGVRVFYLSNDSPTEGVEALLGQIESSSAEPVPASFRANVTPQSPSLYIFTSGTTGLPKAVIINHKKVYIASHFLSQCGVCSKDVVYTALPLYHVIAILAGIGGCIEMGATCVLRSKFSVTHFWKDCRKYNVTVIQYMGELVRYLCNSPKMDNDREHNVRVAVGSGLRADVWKEFLHRFGSFKIYECYGSSEGNAGFLNYTQKVGAMGRSNFFYKKIVKFELVKYDVDQDKVVRDKNGHCIPVAPGKTGLLVTKITKLTPFVGYVRDPQNSEKKILRDVFEKGDKYFNSGDLLMQDHEGFLYFRDRVGDTFRWKSENVATTEVEKTLAMLDWILEVNVYGVSVPGHEGRAGMAAVQLKDGASFDGKKLYSHVKDYMPNYAMPRFIRLKEALETTGTFKLLKRQLVNEGFNPAIITDPLYCLDDTEKCYIPMTQEIFRSIKEKKLRL